MSTREKIAMSIRCRLTSLRNIGNCKDTRQRHENTRLLILNDSKVKTLNISK
jgi:hypothetical protein